MIDKNFWRGKKVFITGHTGFKGSWLTIWLLKLGAEVTGYALKPPTDPAMFEICNLGTRCNSILGDIRDYRFLNETIKEIEPEIIFHLAAQPIVREAYYNPLETYEVNVMGTANLLEAVRNNPSIKVLVNVTTDKVYENKEWPWGYRETDTICGVDPYSNSKSCSELVTFAYRKTYFEYPKIKKYIATARAGNVIGGGDFAKDRIVPDCIKALFTNKKVIIRNPNAIRPWQHVLDPLYGYLLLAEKLYKEGDKFSGAWNFGPEEKDAKTVEFLTKTICKKLGKENFYEYDNKKNPPESILLKLDISKAKHYLKWQPVWDFNVALEKTLEWYIAFYKKEEMYSFTLKQINEFEKDLMEVGYDDK
ncbi:CDP-glucose 4,6-dehydratase [Carboxydothermus pertinax]|uniref:CDP-glucose 4,6-dehydratase n=1 Tax=Carboxydothermus pertinax TaxID=870242 RepID=A0A1L8CUL2_9THEO|nr:CDP-glucose 4,6-dehydratase [Carboxydothermus pertinax]GAV22603.1 CDP-glucose 4,6-dehydratase [Carboxydothermus pertinax]